MIEMKEKPKIVHETEKTDGMPKWCTILLCILLLPVFIVGFFFFLKLFLIIIGLILDFVFFVITY